MKLRSALFSIIICLLLIGPAALFVAQDVLKTDLPGWLSADDAAYLTGGQEKAGLRKNLSLKGFASEKLQAALETTIDNHTPMRYGVLLANAAVQRSVISASNELFGFDAYPTFFGSPTAYVPETDSLVDFPDATQSELQKTTDSIRKLGVMAKEYPEKNFYVIVADRSHTSQANPLHDLVSHSITTEDFVQGMEECTEGIENLRVICISYDSLSEYYENYYHADHHWNGYGTAAVYEKLRTEAGLPYELEDPLPSIDFKGFRANGSYARDGLMLIDQAVTEPRFDLSGFDILNKELPPIAMENGVDELIGNGTKASFNFYSLWYGSALLTEKSPIANENAPLDRNAVVIADSYADSMHWLIARNYEYTKCFRDVRAGVKGDDTLRERIAAAEADDVYFIGGANAFARLPECFPHYFD